MTNLLIEEIPYQQLKHDFLNLKVENKNLLDGLYYAAYVQQGLMPQPRHFDKLGYNYFVVYEPLQIIGGDFFWVAKKGDWDLFAVGDCTGHGVSGAMLSTLAIGFLNYLVYSKEFEEVGTILNNLDAKWIETFNSEFGNEDTINNDWLTISIVAYNKKTKELQFTGAQSAIELKVDNQLILLKGDKFPIGGWQIEKNRVFKTHLLKLDTRSIVYLYTDGIKDQFGGDKSKRFGSKRFVELLTSVSNKKIVNQKELISEQLKVWKGENEQTDDLCLLAFELS